MLSLVLIYAYLFIGCYSLYKTVKVITNEKAQRKSKTIQKLWDIYQVAPAFVIIVLFALNVFFWLPISIFSKIYPDEESKQEAAEIEKEIKDSDE